MTGSQEKSTTSLSKDSVPENLRQAVNLNEAEARIGLTLLDLVKTLAYMDAVDLNELRITKKEDGWLLMLKGTFRNRKKIAFIAGRRFEDVIIQAVTSSDCGYLYWKDDVPPWERK